MPRRDWRLRVDDMVVAAERVAAYVQGLDFEGFKADQLRIDAVLRNLEIIGEAARHIPDEVVARHPDLPWAEMRGMRNVLAHEYFGIDLPVIWKTVTRSLPLLKPLLIDLLAGDDEP